MESIIDRVKRAVTLTPGVYQEIANDPKGTSQAVIVVIVASLIGSLLSIFTDDFGGWLFSGILAPIGLVIGAGIIFLISRLFKATGSYISLFRSLGFASAPQALAIIPVVGAIAGAVWSIILAIRAVKETQGVSDGAAVAIVLIPAAIVAFLVFVLAVILSVALFSAATAG